jgi:PAS domain S-box-containing protein
MKYTFRSLFQIRVIYLTVTLFLMALSFFVFKQVEELIESSQGVNRSTEVALELEKFMGYVKDAEAGHRGYLLTHDSSFLEPFHRGLKQYPKHLKNARLLTAGNAAQQKTLREVQDIIDKRIAHMKKLLEIDKTRTPTKYELRMGKWMMDSLRERIALISTTEGKVLNQRTRVFRKQSIITPAVLLVISLGALVTLFVSYNKINRELTRSKSLQRNQQFMVMEAPAIICMMRGPEHVYEMANEQYMRLIGQRDIIGKPIRKVLPEWGGLGFFELLDAVYTTGKSRIGSEVLLKLKNDDNSFKDTYINFVYRPSINDAGEIDGVLVYGSNVTEQVFARKKVEESEEQLRIAVEGGELGMFDYYPETGKLVWSAKTKEMFGLNPQTEIDYATYVKALHPEDKENLKVVTNTINHPNGGGMYDLEYRVIGVNDGKLRWIRSKGKATFSSDRRPIRFTGVTQDITQRKLAEQILKESEERFRKLVMGLPAAVYSCDARGRITFYNDIATRLWGRAPEIGHDMWSGSWKIFRPDGSPIPFDNSPMALALKEGKPIMGKEIIVERPDGSRANVLAHPQPQFGLSGEVVGAINTLIDITPQVNALKAVSESEKRFRLLAETLPQLIWVTDEKGIQEYVSHRWEEYSGIKPGGEKEWKEIVHPDDYDNINNAWSESLSSGKRYRCDVRLKSKTGEYHWHSAYGEPIYNSDNEIIKWVGSFTDVQDEREFAQQLEVQVQERTYELAVKNSELEKMNKELESFTYVSSHDLQEPLRKIQTFSTRILEKEKANLSETGKDYFTRMQGAASRMQRLIEDLLAFSRASTGERVFEKMSLNTLVSEVEMELKDSISEKQAVIEVAQLCEVNIIPFQFRQLMHNLIGNALKFSKSDTIPRITITSEKLLLSKFQLTKMALDNLPPALVITGKDYCHIRVRDNGIGFEPRFRERIFEVFQRLHGRNEYVGTGIGLAIVKKIVENHEGFITATGEVGEGASFDIYIPCGATT